MMHPELFDKLNKLGQMIRGIPKPFGGIQLILCGDFYQLPPVGIDILCFGALTWNDCVDHTIMLVENMRQQDPVFQQILTEVRKGVVSGQTRRVLDSRIGADIVRYGIKPTRLYPTRAEVADLNKKELRLLLTEENKMQRFKARHTIKSSYKPSERQQKFWMATVEKGCNTPKELDLAVGAQVMLTWNMDVKAGLCNGTRGIVTAFTPTNPRRPEVTFTNGMHITIEEHEFEFKMTDKSKISRWQIPLILSFSMSVHKSQGTSLSSVSVNLSRSFAPGLVYVALSRVRTLEGLSIEDIDYDKIHSHPDADEYYRALEEAG